MTVRGVEINVSTYDAIFIDHDTDIEKVDFFNLFVVDCYLFRIFQCVYNCCVHGIEK